MLKITNTNAKREATSYLVLLVVFWGVSYLFAITNELLGFWFSGKAQGSLNLIALVLAIVIANHIGSISYLGLSLVSLFGILVMAQVLFFRDYALDADSISFPPWRNYVYFIAFVSFVLFLVRHITKRLSAFRQQAGSTGPGSARPLN
jgi:hypothetical protein